jgi:hypothetical protein
MPGTTTGNAPTAAATYDRRAPTTRSRTFRLNLLINEYQPAA